MNNINITVYSKCCNNGMMIARLLKKQLNDMKDENITCNIVKGRSDRKLKESELDINGQRFLVSKCKEPNFLESLLNTIKNSE